MMATLLMVSCANQSNQQSNSAEVLVDDAKVLVYYFHGKQRCQTCNAIQQIAEQAVVDYFSGNEEVKFVEIDFSDKANAALVEKYEIAWSSLIVVSGEQFADLTDDAFANAVRNSEALTLKLVGQVNEYLDL